MRAAWGLVLLGMAVVQGAAPPARTRELTAQEQKHVAALQNRLHERSRAGKFEEAARLALQIAGYRLARQGKRHHETIDAYLEVERWQRWCRVAKKDREEGARAQRLEAEGNQFHQQLRNREAQGKFQEGLEICLKVLGELHPEVASRYFDVGSSLRDQGKHAEALSRYRKALAIRQKVLGEQHSETANSYDSVGFCLVNLGKYAEGLRLLRQALAIRRKVLGEQHPMTANSCNNVAGCLHLQGNHVEALLLFRQALAIQRQVLGAEHSATAITCANVAACLDAQGKKAEALPLLREALALQRKVRGEEHPYTAHSYNNLALCLADLGQQAEALALHRKALAIRQKVLGEQHPDTAQSYTNLASCLNNQDKFAETLPLHRKALAIRQKVLGEQHPDTAHSYESLADCLDGQGKYAEALPLYRKALAIRQKVLGEQHVDTALTYRHLASCLNEQGKQAEALPLAGKALASFRKVLGEEHLQTANSYHGVAKVLLAQGKYAEALALERKALAIHQKVLGEQHEKTATGGSSVAVCLMRLRKHAEALPLLRKTLAIRLDLLGEEHASTAMAYNNLAFCLIDQGKASEALPLFRKFLEVSRKLLGEQHPRTAMAFNNLAGCLLRQGKYAEALPLFGKALEIHRNVQGEQHPDTASCYCNVASCLFRQGKLAQTAKYWQAALLGRECGRLDAASSGFDRSVYRADEISPGAALAVCLVREGKAGPAWEQAESDLARGLLDDLLRGVAGPASTAETTLLDRLRQLDEMLLPLLSGNRDLTADDKKQRDNFTRQRDQLRNELASQAVKRASARVLPLADVQKQLPADAALVFWLDELDHHVGCVLRSRGTPLWVKLPGSGKDDTWTRSDDTLPQRALLALAESRRAPAKLLEALHKQRLAPLLKHLDGVKRLLVIPAGRMSAVPVEALTDRFTISYAPSASVFARRAQDHRPLQGSSVLVVADPVFTHPESKPPAPPQRGLLVLRVLPGSLAARIRLQAGDVLTDYNGTPLHKSADFKPASGDDPVLVKLWRDGKAGAGRIPSGELGVVLDDRPIAEALAAWRKKEAELLSPARGEDWKPLPGTRLEARALAALVRSTTLLLGSEASEQNLEEFAARDRLREFRLLHLATHGEANALQPGQTALILAQHGLPTLRQQEKRVQSGKKLLDGRLTVETVLWRWRLDADLVVLSACQSGLGKQTSGEGMLGFAHALLQSGARSVVLSRWKVDDNATALLMARFYENLLQRKLKRAEALHEAKRWLRQLPRAEGEKRLAKLLDAVPSTERGKVERALPTRANAGAGEERPFAAPYYWAAFVLIGDPD
jgi:tetratricopeptide (TPR) repeat protein